MNKCVLSASGSGHPVVCWLLTAAEMKRCDSNTSEIFGVPSVVLMERAALSCVDVIVSRQKKLEEQAGITTLAWGDVGFRNLTNSKHSVTSPDDLKGLKIRVQDMKSQTDMMKALGGIPVAMSYGDVYTSLQTGIIDGTENNETALTTGKHGEICKVYSTDQHAMIPDVMVMSAKVWKEISPEDQQIILEAARESTESHKIAWDTAIDQAIEEAKNTMGVEFVNDVDKEAFREATSGMINDYCTQYPGVKKLLDIIDSVE